MELGLIIVPFLLALVLPLVGRGLPGRVVAWGMAAVMLVLFGWVLSLLPQIQAGGAIVVRYPWVEALDLSLDLYIDGLAALFALLITGIGAAVFAYAGYYMGGDTRELRFYALMSAFAGSMLGVVLAGNLLLLFIAWELTSIFSFTLIGFDGKKPGARSGAAIALVVTGGGGLALLVGLVLLGMASGSFSMADVLQLQLHEHPWYSAITLLVMLGGFTKSAQFPFHFWLPNGMTAPTPASAYLHSATMVKAGVYLFARLYPTLGDTDLWATGLTAVGLLTMLVGSLNAIRQRDLKGLLAYATVSWLGTLVFLLGLPHHEGYEAALVGVIAHALYKSPLFMVAGVIDHATGTRDIGRLGGLFRRMPDAAALTVVAGLSMAGVIPFLGFVAKESLLHSVVETHDLPFLGITLVAASLTVTAALILAWDVFFRPAVPTADGPEDHGAHGHEAHGHGDGHFHAPPRLMLLGPAVVAALSLVAALWLEPLVNPLLGLAAGEEVSLYLFGGFNEIFLLSLVAVALGLAVFLVRERWLAWSLPPVLNATRAYHGLMDGISRAGDIVLRTQTGRLSHYLAIMLGVVGLLMILPGYSYLSGAPLEVTFSGSRDFMKAVLLLLTVGATLASILFKGHLLAALALGVAGYAVGGIFLLEPGPDVAMVQILVETLAAVMVLIMLSRISEGKRRQAASALWGRGRHTLRRDILVSLLVGLGVGAFALAAVLNRPERDSRLATWYLENAEQVGVRDVVGGIVTDFRGADTMIEITVFSMAALGVLTVLFLRRGTVAATTAPVVGRIASRIETPLTRMVATLVLPIAVLIALAHLLYAGDAPGDGFTAGVVGGISISLWYQVFGYDNKVLRRLRAEVLIGIGLTLALANALAPLLFGQPFLQHNDLGDIPLPAGLHFTSTTIFEIAIFLTILGSVITMINAITHPEGIEEL